MSFLWPHFLWLMLALPLLPAGYLWLLRRRGRMALRYTGGGQAVPARVAEARRGRTRHLRRQQPGGAARHAGARADRAKPAPKQVTPGSQLQVLRPETEITALAALASALLATAAAALSLLWFRRGWSRATPKFFTRVILTLRI